MDSAAGLSVYRGEPIFDGGYISRHYATVHGIDCVQLEFHRDYRASVSKAEDTGRRLAACLRDFLLHYPPRLQAAADAAE